ncbi:MAG TPA: CYTH domain-containing protein [Candidatus Magasanikbacteria bacterium]|nr:CYTH domain-containing protein [Candidatus Magasanikbacteria bacterium]
MTNPDIDIEYEATFYNINVDEIRDKIKILNGKLLKPMYNQKRTVFSFPKGHEIKGGWLRVRDESDKITMTLKIMESNESIDGQKEIELVVDSYENAIKLLKTIGAEEKAIQETRRELWKIDRVEIMIDWWPFLEPIIEIEGENESDVKQVAEKLGFDWNKAIFNSIDHVYSKKYGISIDRINNNTPKIMFDMENPFLN